MRQLAHLANLITLLCLLYLLTGCKSLEQRCLERFPTTSETVVREYTVTDTLILPEQLVEYVDTTYCPPALPDTVMFTKRVVRYLKPDTIYRDVICTDTVTVLREDARLAGLETELATTRQRLKAAKREYPLLAGISRILTLLIVLAFVYYIGRILKFFG
jgi:hypothetical protein